MKKFYKLLFFTILWWFFIHMTFIVIDGLTDNLGKADVAVVLGNKVEKDGQPSPRLKSRLDRTIELYQRKYFDLIIVSGGIGKEGYDEADVMKDYLINFGIPANKILIDNQGLNTFLTAQNTRKLTKKLNFQSVLLVTQYYHITRTKLAFKKAGFRQIYSAHAYIFEWRDFYSLIREFFGYYQYLWRS